MPPKATVRPPLVVGLPKHCYSYSPCALDHDHGPNVATKH